MSISRERLFIEKYSLEVLKDTQEGFARYFNGLGKVMASMPDFYKLGKSNSDLLNKYASLGSSCRTNLIYDFSPFGGQMISSTRIHYEQDSLDAVITHYFGSAVVKPNKIKILVPDYSASDNSAYPTLKDILKTEKGLKYFQALCNTNDDAKTIYASLERLTMGGSGHTIFVATLGTNKRRDRHETKDIVATFGGMDYRGRYFFRADYSHNVGTPTREALAPFAGLAHPLKSVKK
jgi:hypothetical protein